MWGMVRIWKGAGFLSFQFPNLFFKFLQNPMGFHFIFCIAVSGGPPLTTLAAGSGAPPPHPGTPATQGHPPGKHGHPGPLYPVPLGQAMANGHPVPLRHGHRVQLIP